MERNPESAAQHVDFMKNIVKQEKLLGLTKLLYQQCLHSLQGFLKAAQSFSTRFSMIADLLRESSYWAETKGEKEIDGRTVSEALAMRKYFASLPEEKMMEEVFRGTRTIRFSGRKLER